MRSTAFFNAARRPCWVGLVCALLVLAGSGCRLLRPKKGNGVQGVSIEHESGTPSAPLSPFELQSRVTSFADGFAIGLRTPVVELQQHVPREQAADVHRWFMSHANTAFILASGPNPVVNALDLTGMATLARMVLEEYWIPEVYGEAGKPLLEYHRKYEREIWQVTSEVLTDEQEAQLYELISSWRDSHPTDRHASFVSICEYAKDRWSSPLPEPGQSRSLLRMVYLDPLSNLDPATRQLALTRYTAERLIYFLQRSPTILRLETEMLLLDVANNLDLEKLFSDIDLFSRASNRFVTAIEALPGQIAEEQKKFLEEVSKQENDLTEISREYRTAFQAGSEMASSVARAIASLDAYTERVTTDADDEGSAQAVHATGPEPDEGRPYDVLDYATTAGEVSKASQNLDETIRSFDKLLASPAWQERQGEVNQLLAQVEASAERMTQALFLRALIVVGLLVAGALVVALVVRRGRPPQA